MEPTLISAGVGDLLDEEKLLKWLTSEEAMDLPDRIDEVNRKVLQKMINESDYVACFFCKTWLVGCCTRM